MSGMEPMRVLLCPNAFKGSLTALEAARAMAEGLERVNRKVGARRFEPVLLPLADGGDGTLDTLVAATGGTVYTTEVCGPLEGSVTAQWGRLGGERRDTAVIEMAEASGLRLLRFEERDPLRATTYGTGELMRAAVDAGCTRLLVGIGGSATNDCGAGMAQALGARLLDKAGAELPFGGAALAHLAHIDMSGWLLSDGVEVIAACDVDNPLCGPEGASTVYGPQKGATPEMVRELDAALRHGADILREQIGADVAETPGAGAAGGLGAGLMAFCGATLRPGTELALEAVRFDDYLPGSGLVLTGEGRLDGQTARGKVVAGVAQRARRAGVPSVAIAGSIASDGEELLQEQGLTAAFSMVNGPQTLEEAMGNAYAFMADTVARLAFLLLAFDR